MGEFSISILDLLLLIVTGFFGFRSLFKGIVRAIFSLLGISAAYLVASLYYKLVAAKLASMIGALPWLDLAGFSLLFLGVLIVFGLIETTLLQFFAGNVSSGKDLAGLLAFFIGLMEGFLLCSAILWLLQNRDFPSPVSKALFQNSIFASYYLNYNPLLLGLDSQLDSNLFR